MNGIWLAGLYAVVVGAAATALGLASGVLWATGSGLAALATGTAYLVYAWPTSWCVVLRVRGRSRVHHWHRPKSEIVKCGRSAGLRATWR